MKWDYLLKVLKTLDFYEIIYIINLYFKKGAHSMKKIICKREYDTDNATLIKKYTYSYLGDPAGYEECLYQTPDGLYFLYVCGGETSPYTSANILRLAKAKVNDWLENH